MLIFTKLPQHYIVTDFSLRLLLRGSVMADNTKLLSTLRDLSGEDILALVGFKSMPFNAKDVGQWFTTLEHEFVKRKIETDLLQYFLTLAQLDADKKSSIQHVISYVPATQKYQTLKRALISKTSLTTLQNALNNVDLTKNKPSTFLEKIVKLSENIPKRDIVKVLWLRSLPTVLQDKLLCATEDWSDIGAKADVFNDLDTLSGRQILTAFRRLDVNFEKFLEDFKPETIEENKVEDAKSNANPERNLYVCYFHAKFGNAARNCKPPCDWSPCDTCLGSLTAD